MGDALAPMASGVLEKVGGAGADMVISIGINLRIKYRSIYS